MAERIKGITVEIGGNTIGLEKSLEGVNKTSRSLQGELKDVQRLLKFDPNNATLLAQKQKLLNDEITNSSDKLNKLKQAQAEVTKQFNMGEIGADQYRAFQRELASTENALRSTQAALENMEQEQNNAKKSSQQLNRLFQVTGKSVEDYADILGTKLVRSIQNGTATSRDLERAFIKIGTAATGSSDNIDKIKDSLNKLEGGKASVNSVRKEIQKISTDADDAKKSINDLGGELGTLVAGAAAGAGIGTVVGKALDSDTLDTKIDITFDVPDESKGAVKEAVQSIQAYGIEGGEALEATRRLWALNGDAGDAANQRIIKGAGMIATSYAGIDVTELVQETNEMGEALGITQEQALGMTNTLLKMGFPPEQIDIISEYGSQLHRAGYTAEQIQGIFAAGVETKSWNIDVLLDGLKEGRIRITEFGSGIDDTTAKMIEGTGISATKLQEWGKAIAGGGEAGQQAMGEVSTALAGIEDATLRNQIGTQLFGTLWEEQGDKITTVIDGANTKTGDLKTNVEGMNDAVAATDASSQVELNNALTAMNNALMPLYTNIANFATLIANWIAQNPTLAATIAAVVVGIGILIGVFMIIIPLITAIIGLAGVLGVSVGAVVAPFLLVIAIVAAVIAIAVLLIKNWDTIIAAAGKLASNIKTKFNEFKEAAINKMKEAKEGIQDKWDAVVQFFEGISLSSIGKEIIQGLIDGLSSMGGAIDRKVDELAAKIPQGLKDFLGIGSPSKVTMKLGKNTGEGFALGLEDSLNQIGNMSNKMALSAVPDIKAPKINSIDTGSTKASKEITVNFHSPKALDVREANKQLQRTLNKMSLQW